MSTFDNIKKTKSSDFIMTEGAKQAFDVIEEDKKNLFITGKAGSGKSFFINELLKRYKSKNIVLVAPTGIAAINIGGSTIHSFFKLPVGMFNLKQIKPSKKVKQLLENTDIIIIDEISMVRADVFDAINVTCQKCGRPDKEFGGKRVIVVGDLEQLPPIVSKQEEEHYFNKYNGVYFYDSKLIDKENWSIVEFDTVFRQSDDSFIKLLNNVRDKENLDFTVDQLNKRHIDVNRTDIVTLTPYRKQELEINKERLEMIKGTSYTFDADIEGKFEEGKYPTEKELVLKVGALVMTITNDIHGRYVNGTTGTITEIEDDYVKIDVNGKDIKVEMKKFVNYDYKVNGDKIEKIEIGSFTQFPIKLAWAITIHKSQGKTLDEVIIDKGRGMFSSGQMYVALSRCKSIEGLYLTKPLSTGDIL